MRCRVIWTRAAGQVSDSYRRAVHKVLENKASFKHIHIPFLEHGNGRGKHVDGESDYPAPRCSSFPATAWTAPVPPLLPFPQEQLGALQREEAGPCLCFPTWLPSQGGPRAGEGPERQEPAGAESSVWAVFLHSQRTR